MNSDAMHRNTLFFLFMLSLLGTLSAQSGKCDLATYNDFIAKGQTLVKSGDYIQAFEYYNSAKDYCPENGKEVDGLVQDLIAKITEDKQQTEEALAKAEKLVNAFSFYADRFALAFNEGSFYFIDKNGEEVAKLGRWKNAEQFNWFGFARVKKEKFIGLNKRTNETIDYMIDTFSNSYLSAYAAKDLHSGIRILDLSDEMNLSILPDNIFQNPQLEVLIVPRSYLKTLSPQIGKLSSLKKLYLGGNGLITYVPRDDNPWHFDEFENLDKLSTLPVEIWGLKNLIVLDLGQHQLTVLPAEIGQLTNLMSLNLSSNKISELPSEIGQLTNLTSFYLDGNGISKLPAEIGQLTNLTRLDLSENQLTELPAQIGVLQNLKHLKLTNNPIPKAEQEKIRKWLPNCKIQF